MIFKFAFAALVFLLSANTALACRPAADFWAKWVQQSIEEKTAGSQAVFIGTVASLNDGNVQFKVEIPIRGVETPVFEFTAGRTSCHEHFSPGERWLFAGAAYFQGSKQLQNMDDREIRELRQMLSERLPHLNATQTAEAQKLLREWPYNSRTR